jgi:hypothetical protein
MSIPPGELEHCYCGHPELTGTHRNSGGIMCFTEKIIGISPDEGDPYMEGKLQDRGYPGYPATSQADEIINKANSPGMYPSTLHQISMDPTCWAEYLSPTTARLDIENIPNEQAKHVILEVLPKVLELYLSKSRDYGGSSGGLGPKASFVDIWRKVIKLKRSLWDGEELKFEQPKEIVQDLVGTCLNILGELI